MSVLHLVLGVLSGVIALGLLVLILRNRIPGGVVMILLGVLELGLVVQLVLGIVRIAGDHAGVPVGEYLGYLLASLLLLPVGVIWSAGERTRSGTAVLLVAVLVVPVMFLRLNQIWSLHG